MGIRILVIEDEANIADYLVTGLREEGYTVEHAADGDRRPASPASPRSWDLVLLDWWLPGRGRPGAAPPASASGIAGRRCSS